MSNIKQITNHSKWTIGSSVVFIILQAIQLVIITHFISKNSFGYLSIANVFVFLSISLLDSGVVLKIVQADRMSDSTVKKILLFNVKFAMILSVLVLLAGFFLRWIYDAPQMIEITMYMIPVVLISSVNAVFLSKMRRDLEFDLISIIEIISVLISFALVIWLSINGWEYMAVVLGYLVKVSIVAILILIFKKHQLSNDNHGQEGDDYIEFGKFIYGEKILTSIISNADSFIIGKWIGIGDLGVYDIFKKAVLRPIILFYNAVEQVVFSLLSKQKSNAEEFNSLYRSFSLLINYTSFSIMGLILINAEFIILLFPESYSEYILTFKLFIGLILSIILFNPIDLLLYTQGKTKLFLKWMLIYTGPLIIIMVISAFINLNALIINCTIFYLILYVLAYFILIKKQTSLDYHSYFITVLKPLIFVGCLSVVIMLIAGKFDISSMGKLLMSIFCFVLFSLLVIRFEKEFNLKKLVI